MASRFAQIDFSVSDFIKENENENTTRKTRQNVALLQEFLVTRDETRPFEEIPPQELNTYLSEFIISVRKKSNEEYEPNTLRSMIASFERHLKNNNYGFSIIKDLLFEQTRKALQSKQKELKKKGKGNKPNASAALTEDEIELLYEKGQLGTDTPDALLNTIWFNNTIHFGLRGCKEHRDMRWSDVKLRQTTSGTEFLEYHERQTKTRTGENPRDIRKTIPKMFSVSGSEKDPVAIYKLYVEKRPTEMKADDSPFYLAVNNTRKHDSRKPWFKKSAVGVNKLNMLMKKMAEKAGLGPNVTNHSGRKTMMQTLANKDIAPTNIIQLSGHKNLQSVNNYSTLSERQQMQMSRTLSDITMGAKEKSDPVCVSRPRSTPSAECSQGQQAMSLFSGAVIHGGQISISINTLNQSPTLSSEIGCSPSKRYKRINVLNDSDSD